MTATGSLRAGAAKLDITPPLDTPMAGSFDERRATDVDDSLSARALVLEAGDIRLALVACDIIALPFEEHHGGEGADRPAYRHPGGVHPLAATHAHRRLADRAAGDAPCRDLYGAVAGAVRPCGGTGGETPAPRACRQRRAAGGRGDVLPPFPDARRDGAHQPRRGNPDAVEPVSPIDPALTVLYLEDAETRQALALWANFTLHYVGTDHGNAFSADYFGRFARIVESALGGQALALLTNGASGQINNVDVRDKQQPGGAYQAERVARVVAGAALSAGAGQAGSPAR